MIVIILAAAALLALGIVRIAPPAAIRVVDGDSLVITGRNILLRKKQVSCRMAGIDAPEWNQPHGVQASRALRRMLAGRRVLVLTTGRCAYGRRRVRLWTVGGPVAWRMVARGHAHADGIVGLLPQAWAWALGRGLWRRGSGSPRIHPSIWRAGR